MRLNSALAKFQVSRSKAYSPETMSPIIFRVSLLPCDSTVNVPDLIFGSPLLKAMLLTNILSLDFVTSGKKGKFANSLQFEININDKYK